MPAGWHRVAEFTPTKRISICEHRSASVDLIRSQRYRLSHARIDDLPIFTRFERKSQKFAQRANTRVAKQRFVKAEEQTLGRKDGPEIVDRYIVTGPLDHDWVS